MITRTFHVLLHEYARVKDFDAEYYLGSFTGYEIIIKEIKSHVFSSANNL